MINPDNDAMMVTMTVGQLKKITQQVVDVAINPLIARIENLQDSIRVSDDDIAYGMLEISHRLGVSEKTLQKAIKAGLLDGVIRKFGNQYRAKKSDLDKLNLSY